MLRYLNFAFWEAVTSLWRSRVLNLLSIGTIMFAMFVLSSFILVGYNLESMTVAWRDQIRFNAFLAEGTEEESLNEIREILASSLVVEEATYISKEDARDKFGNDFASYTTALEALQENPFPASFQVSLMRGTKREVFKKLQQDLERHERVEEVYYDEEVFKRLDFFVRLIRLAGWFFGSVMVFSSIFTISNVLKLTFFTRREEVDIMKLVGASRAYIRGPFIIEGILIGILGSTSGVILLYLGHLVFDHYVSGSGAFLMTSLRIYFLPLSWVILLLVSGAVSGLLGSLFSLHKFLEEHISYH